MSLKQVLHDDASLDYFIQSLGDDPIPN
jgi:hypothetical protein